jgi:hypothetical protein
MKLPLEIRHMVLRYLIAPFVHKKYGGISVDVDYTSDDNDYVKRKVESYLQNATRKTFGLWLEASSHISSRLRNGKTTIVATKRRLKLSFVTASGENMKYRLQFTKRIAAWMYPIFQ